MTDTLTIKETRRLIQKLRTRILLTVTQADDLLRLCDGLSITEDMAEILENATHIIDCDDLNCSVTKDQIETVRNADRILGKWDRWLGNA